jgi:hypothetical protein
MVFTSNPLRFLYQSLVSLLLISLYFITATTALAENTHSVTTSAPNNQYLALPDAGATSVDVTSSFTIEAWVKLNSIPTSVFTIASKWNEVNFDRNYSLEYTIINGTDAYIQLGINDTGEIGHGNNLGILYTLPIGEWQHIAVTYNTSNTTAKFYVNGVLVGQAQGTIASLTNGNAEFRIGSRQYDNTHFDGHIDEVRLWHTVRSEGEIVANFLNELSLPQANLGGYWKLNQNGLDASGNGNNLTPVGNPVFSTDKPFPNTPPPPTVIEAIKPSLEVRTATTLQPDSHLTLLLPGSSTYTIAGSLVFPKTSSKNDVYLQLNSSHAASSALKYSVNGKSVTWPLNSLSKKINLDSKKPTIITVEGTLTASQATTLTLLWAPARTTNPGTTLDVGSYLRATKQ